MTQHIRAAHALILSPQGTAVLQQKTEDYIPNPGCLSMFGGGVETGESPREALCRELFEELGLEVCGSELEGLGTYWKTHKHEGVSFAIQVFIVKNISSEGLNLNEGACIVNGTIPSLLEDNRTTRITRLALSDLRERLP